MTRPAVAPASRWHFPTPQEFVLPGGLAVQAFDLPGQHVAAIELVMPAPLRLEQRAVEGVATIALNACDEGTHPNPAGRIAELLERQGAALDGVAAQSHTRLGGDAPVHRLGAVLELFAEVVQEPRYDETDIAHHVELQEAAFESRLASPEAVARQAFHTALFGEDAREGRPAAGTPETLSAICREAVLAWHEARWTSAGATLVIAGDLGRTDLDEALAPLRGWSAGQPTPATDPAPRPARCVVVDMPAAVQATIQTGCLTVGRRHPDWAALKLGMHAMAGAFASRLNLELRERRGFTYGVHGGLTARGSAGQLGVGGSFRTEVAAESAAVIRRFLHLEDPFTATEIDDARRYLVGIAPLANETAGDIARQAAALAAGGEAPGFVNEHFAALEGPTAQQVTDAWRRHIRVEELTMALSGAADHLMPALRAVGVDAGQV